jgi:uroporphyrinogen III methyltransferase/synthase
VSRGRVYLVGAGPGDPGLLTVRALECLRAAEVVAYDELVSSAILALASTSAEMLPVGRRHGSGKASYRLHPDVLARARSGRCVVRLKAGDPLVFGRGGEEAEELTEAGIPCEIVPGISAALGAAAYAGIPLTHRDHASHVTFATGHDVDGSHGEVGGTPYDTRGTLVLFMASRKLAANLEAVVRSGRAPSTPAAYIAWATTPAQTVVVGTLADLTTQVAGVDPLAPAIVIIGDVVSVRDRIRAVASSPHAAVAAPTQRSLA